MADIVRHSFYNTITSVGISTTDEQPAVAEAMAGEGGENGTTFELFCGGFEGYC